MRFINTFEKVMPVMSNTVFPLHHYTVPGLEGQLNKFGVKKTEARKKAITLG